MRIIIVPASYGNQSWKLSASGSPDKIIFLGDYLDYFGKFCEDINAHVDNFKEILEYATIHPDRAVLLLGPTDMNYLFPKEGFKDNNIITKEFAIRDLFKKHAEFFKICYTHHDYLFSNGYITERWYNSIKEKALEKLNITYSSLSDLINSMILLKETREMLNWKGWEPTNNTRNYTGPFQTEEADLYYRPILGYKHIINGPKLSDKIIKLDIFDGNAKYSTTEAVICNTASKDNYMMNFLTLNTP